MAQVARVPGRIAGHYLGKSGESGEMERNGEKIVWTDGYSFTFKDPDGLVANIELREKDISDAANFDIRELPEMAPVLIEGVAVVGGTNPGKFRPSSILRVDPKTGAPIE